MIQTPWLPLPSASPLMRPMPTTDKQSSFVTLVTLAACAAAFMVHSVRAQGSPIGFEEHYALAKSRSTVVANLIPGTADWYYYHCRERLDARDFETVRKVLPTWIKRHGRTQRVLEIENREALLTFDENPERTYSFLQKRLGVNFRHQRAIPGARSDLPTRLDPNLISPTVLRARALKRHRNTVNGFEDRALAALAATELDDKQLHSLLKRLRRPDVPNLPALIVRNLKRRESSGFGSLAIHNLLRREQLDECAQLRRELLQNDRFIRAYLQRLQPNADIAWREDKATRLAHLQGLWSFARGLSPRFNSLKAHILFHWLQHDLAEGTVDKERFLAYIRLPRRSGFAAKAHLERHQRQSDHVNLTKQYPTLMQPIGNDSGLVTQCLEHLFQTEESVEAYSDYLDANYLKRQLAMTKIMSGQGDMERWYSLLNDPAQLERLEKRVELRFPPTMRQHYGAKDQVTLALETKNVQQLIVKVFAIDSYRYHVERQKQIDATIELDGVVPNQEQTYNYTDPPMRRVRRTFDLPMLTEPGTYVVEFVGNGISSRAVIHKGGLRMVERTSAAGQVVRVYDETGRHVKGASAWFGGRDYESDDRGEIRIPFSTDPGNKKIVLRAGNRSSIAAFAHRAESYSLVSNVYVDRESLIDGNTANLVIRPQLALANHQIAADLLEDTVLTIKATDLDGQSTTQEVRDLDLQIGKELVHKIRVPRRLTKLQVQLSGQLKKLSGQEQRLTGSWHTFEFNGIDKTAETSTPMLLHTTSGYAVELRGKSGELQAGRVLQLQLFHRDYRDPIQLSLQTDEQGRVQLGRLAGIDRLQVKQEQKLASLFQLRTANARIADVLHGTVGGTLRVPYQGSSTAPSRSEFTLLGHNHDAFEHLAIADGFLEIRDLKAGDYSLQMHDTGDQVTIRITAGQPDGRYLVGRDRILARSPTQPLQLREVRVDGEEVRVQIANATEGTRAHIVALRYLPAYDMFAYLEGRSPATPSAVDIERALSSYHAGRKLSDEYRYVLERRFTKKYPGNMLDRPSMLLNPMQLAESSFNAPIGLGGGAGGRYGGRNKKAAGSPASPKARAQAASGQPGGRLANLDYLPRGSSLISNLRPDANGIVSVPLAALGDGQDIHVLVIDGHQAIYDTATRAEQPLKARARSLTKSLDAKQHLVESRHIDFLAANETATIDQAHSPKVEVYDSLASIFRLFTTISNNSDLQKFAFVVDWPKMTPAQKADAYSKNACHELHFFLRQKDPEFFRAIVEPFLRNKLQKTFLDHWLLDSDLIGYLEPWKFAQLNVIEQILLAQRLGGDERESVARNLRELLELNPQEPDHIITLFAKALDNNRLWYGADKAGDMLSGRPNAAIGSSTPSTGSDDFFLGTQAQQRGRPREERRLDRSALEQSKQEEEAIEEVESLGRVMATEKALRKNYKRFYVAVAETKKLVEQNYWQRRRHAGTADVVAPNSFWVDFAARKPGQPFVSAALVEATGSFLEMMMALSVIDLPFEAGEHEIKRDAAKSTLRAKTPLLLVRKEISNTNKAADAEPLLLGQNFYRLNDRYRFVDGQRRDAFITDEFLTDVAYGCQVVVTNPTSSTRIADILLQIPEGAVPLQNGFWTRGRPVQLAAYATKTISYAFYFPRTGTFSHYPAHATEKGKLIAYTDASSLKVVDEPSKLDTSSWQHVSQQGTAAEVMAFIDTHNLKRIALDKVAWRMRDRAFFETILPKLRKRHTYHSTLWSYGLLHRDAPTTREYLRHRGDFLNQCGDWLESPLVSIDPVERRRYEHLELNPLVHQRAHQLGDERRIGNADLANQYGALMRLLSYRPRLDSKDWLAVTYYFLLQDRVEEALDSFAKIEPNAIEAKVQYDYLSAYLCFFTGETEKARRIATTGSKIPVPHWQKRFDNILSQLDEAEGKDPATSAEQTPDSLAATAPALELALEGRTAAISYKNLTEVEVRYYELDVEFAFSSQPFAGPDGASAAFVQPNQRESRNLDASQQQVTFELPQKFWQKNVLVEVRAQGLVRSRQYFANAIDVRFLESYGQVSVTEPNTKKPLSKTYVKVFAKLANGDVRFHKDGYTDLRGRFDYVSVSDDPNRGAQRYAVLVLDETRGAVIREINPPAQ